MKVGMKQLRFAHKMTTGIAKAMGVSREDQLAMLRTQAVILAVTNDPCVSRSKRS